MRGQGGAGDSSLEGLRAAVVERLRARSAEIENAIFSLIRRLSEPVGDEDSAYIVGLRNAVVEAVDYGLKCMERDEEWSVPIPPGAVDQARRAARLGVGLDIVLRRYSAGSRLVEEFAVKEAMGLSGEALPQLLSSWNLGTDRLMEAVAEAYRDELALVKRSDPQKQAERIMHLLGADGPAGATVIDYDFDAWHVGMILVGPGTDVAVRVLAERLGFRLLEIEREEETVWAWLSGIRQPRVADVERILSDRMPTQASAAIGEPRHGLEGWRLTHREAQVALQVLLQRPKRLVRGRDVVLLAGMLRDETLVRALLDTYLAPLEEDVHAGPVLLETLRAYFAAAGNAAAAAVELGVTRHTVQRRIRTVEQKLGRLLYTCQAELEVALQIDELNQYSRRGGG